MAISWDSFDKIWASTSPLTPYSFSDPNYAQGWNFVGSTPPARQMWDSIQKQNDEKFKYLRDNFGTPNIVTQASQMTDTDKVYVYLGSEAGWNNGHWYYYDEGTSSWADGGVYNSVAFVTDTTLSIAGQPADAKATGDALALKSDLAGCTFTGNVGINADLSVTGDSTLADTTVNDLVVNNDLSVAGDSSLTNLSVSGTTALAGTSTAPTPSADDNSTKIATTQYVQTEIKPIEVNADIVNKRVTNIEKLLQGNLYDYQTDTDSKYVKTVPNGAMPYASLDSIGGKTVVFNQLYRVVDGSSTTYDVSIVRSASANTYTVSGTANATGTIWLTSSNPDGTAYSTETLINGHKYATLLKGNNLPLFRHSFDIANKSNKSYILTGNGSWRFPVGIEVTSGVTYNFTVKIMLVDITLMFGAGNEPTIEQFETMYPADWYSATYGTLLSAGVTEVESVGRNLLDKNAVFENWTNILYGYYYTFRLEPNTTYFCYSTLPPAPDNSANLFFYASNESANTNINGVWNGQTRYVTTLADGIVILFSRSTGYSPQTKEYYLSYDFMLAKSETPVAYAPYKAPIQYPIPAEVQALEGYGWSAGSAYNYIDYERKVFVKNVGSRAYASGDESDATVITDGTTTYYPLNPAVETDISAYITDDNLIEVEAGGSLTFPNSNGTDYQIPIPSSETYMVDLQASL